jgi:flagellar hook-associated protein 2
MAISATGIGSGIDVESLVTQLITAEGQPAANRLDTKEAKLQASLSAFGSLKSALSAFQAKVKLLNDETDFLARTTTSSNTDLFTATANKTAVEGSYEIEVFQLAQAAKVRTGDFVDGEESVVGTGTLDISLGSDTFQLTISEPDNTLADVRDAINNAEDNPGITASIINVDGGSRLVLSSDKVGLENAISIVANDDDALDGNDLTQFATANLTSLQDAQDAIIYVDNQMVTRDSNSFSDVISGVTFSLKDAEEGTKETLTISLDKSSVKDKVTGFVDAYNTLADTMATLSSYDADTGAAGTLLGDSALRGVQSQIRQTMSDAIKGLDFSTLVDLGVTTDDEGHLEIDDDKLDSVLDQDFTAVAQLFSSENGLANKLDDVIDRYISDDGGILVARTDGLQSRIDEIDEDRERLELRLEALEARYRAQFTAMDTLVAQMQSMGDYLTQQLANLPGVSSSN